MNTRAIESAYIVSAVRTPIGKHRGALSSVRADDLAAHVLQHAIARSGAAMEDVSEVIFGATNQAGEDNRNVARMAALLAGLPFESTGVTVNRLCGSGMEAIRQAARAIALGEHDVIVAGGVESMTRAPLVMAKSDEAHKSGVPAIFDSSLGWRFPNPKMAERFPLESMGETAENVADKYNISREDQDRFAVTSHERAVAAWAAGRFDDEVVGVSVSKPKGEAVLFSRDESPREDASVEKLARLSPVFRKGGSVTAGNSSPLNDGASALLIASESFVRVRSLEPVARIVGSAVAGVEPRLMGIGPVPAIRKLLAKTGLSIEDIDLVELNEAFAAQSLACIRELGLDASRVNVNGGGIALGHPIGSSGARIVATLVHEMNRRKARYGLAALCIGVGQGLALLVERTAS